MEKSLYQIFKTFFKVGTLLLGGGYVILPLLQSELVDKKHWIDDDTLCEYYALSQSVPGIIAANTAMFTGYKLRGTAGAFTATIGLVLPAFVSIIIIARILGCRYCCYDFDLSCSKRNVAEKRRRQVFVRNVFPNIYLVRCF